MKSEFKQITLKYAGSHCLPCACVYETTLWDSSGACVRVCNVAYVLSRLAGCDQPGVAGEARLPRPPIWNHSSGEETLSPVVCVGRDREGKMCCITMTGLP